MGVPYRRLIAPLPASQPESDHTPGRDGCDAVRGYHAPMTAIVLILAVLATARLTRLVTEDKLLEPFRFWLARRWPADSKRLYLFHCPWCFGMWVALVVAPVVWFAADLSVRLGVTAWVGVPLLALAISHAVGLLKGAEA